MRRSPLTLIILAFGVVALVVGVAASALLWTPWGRSRLCARISESVSNQIAGSLVIREIEKIDLPNVKARDIKILAPDGRAAIEVESADIELDILSLLEGDFGWRRAEIKNGTVRVTEDDRGKNNMEETFKASKEVDEEQRRKNRRAEESGTEGEGELDLRTMITSNMTLIIEGGDLPTMRLVDVRGIMRIRVESNGDVDLRFDEYRGKMTKGLPHGVLAFRDVKGHVQTGKHRLLQFEGGGRFEGERVAFELDIFTEPENKVEIDARFPELSPASLSTLGLDAWSKFAPGLKLNVRHGK